MREPAIVSAIDLGTNTVLMVTAAILKTGENEEGRNITVIADDYAVGRLGEGVDADGLISQQAVDRITSILLEYREKMRLYGTDVVIACGTSALRDAQNRDEFIETIEERTGVRFTTLSGPREAELTWRGSLFGLSEVEDTSSLRRRVIDIGGGSTEISVGRGEWFEQGVSIDTGAVRVTERYFRSTLPPTPAQIEEAREATRQLFELHIPRSFTTLFPTDRLVGVAGTITTLGAIRTDMREFNPSMINGLFLPTEWIHQECERILAMSLEETRSVPQISSGRADIISGGLLVLDEFLKYGEFEGITVSTAGLRYGLLSTY